MDSVLFSKEGAVALITLNRPQVYNSFNREMALQLQGHLDSCQNDPGIRAVYLSGAGKAFSAGQDLNEVTGPQPVGLTTILGDHYNPIIQRIRSLRKPIVAAVNGVAAGAGANIALACDIVVAAYSASFIQAFSKIGLIPDSGGTFFLPRLIGFQRASALAMLGDKVSATDAVAMGMIYQAFPDDDFAAKSRAIAEKLAAMPTKGLWLAKQAFNESMNNTLDQQLELEETLQVQAGQTADYQEGVQAFLEKRPPIFKGE